MKRARLARCFLVALLALTSAPARAQESGGSFGGSAWDDEPSGGGGGGSDWGSSGGSDWGASSAGPSQDDWAEQQARQAREEEARREAERRAEEEREAARRAEEARIAAERARILALPPPERVRAIAWPATPAFSPLVSSLVSPASARGYDASESASAWTPPAPAAIGPATVVVTGPWNGLVGFVFGLPCTLVGFAFALLATHRWRRAAPSPTGSASRWAAPVTRGPAAPVTPTPGPAMRLSIAFDWTVRAQLQQELAAMATRFDLRTRPGLGAAAHALTTMLGPLAPAARYVSWELSTGDARTWFQNRANDLRARFRAELVRNDRAHASPAFHAKEHEGEGLVVVSVLVAGKRPMTPPPARFDQDALEVAIARLDDRPEGETIALEVIWSPAAENDRMSSYELEKLYPELRRIREGVGARQCLYCKGPFATELGRCPSCGAPV